MGRNVRVEDGGRRRLLAAAGGAGLASLVPSALAQQTAQLPATELGALHMQSLGVIAKELGGTPAVSREGMLKLVNLLGRLNATRNGDREALRRLVEALFGAPNVSALVQNADALLKDSLTTASDAVIAILSIARDSAQHVLTLPEKGDLRRAVRIVAADVSGAMQGAATGSRFSRIGLLLCILGGAVAGSANEWLKEPGPKS